MPSIFAPNPLTHWEPYPIYPRIAALEVAVPFKGTFAELLLQHDSVIMPTADFSILPVLLSWLGYQTLCEVLESGSLSFSRHLGSIAYFPGGAGLEPYELRPSKQPKDFRERVDFNAAAPTDEAAELYLSNEVYKPDKRLFRREKNRLLRLVLDHTRESGLVPTFRSRVAEVTYRDIEQTASLRRVFLDETGKTNLRRLGDLTLRESRVYRAIHRVIPDTESEVDEVDFLLWMAAANYEFAMAEDMQADHVLVEDHVRSVIVRRHRRGASSSAIDARGEFGKLLEAERIPSIPDAFVSGALDFDTFWRLRESANGQRFREWFTEALNAGSGEDIRNAYIRTWEEPNWFNSFPGKVFRAVIPTAVGIVDPQAGLIASAADFVLGLAPDKWSPRLFLSDLRKASAH